MQKKYFQPEKETMSAENIKKIQDEKLVKQVRYVYDNVEYYRRLMDEKGVKPEDIKGTEDLHKLPFVKKDDLREAYPYGLLATDIKNCVRIHSTSGTTGKRVVAFYTQNDVDMWEECCARAIVAAGGDKHDVCQVSYGYGLFTGGAGLHGGSHKVGCLTLPMSSGNTDRQIQFMMDLNSTILCCTPSYAAYIGESLKEKGFKPEDNKLKAGIFGAEPWTEEMRRNIENSLGIKAYDIYGLTEISGPGVAFECEEQSGMHINEDHFIAEIINPDTGEVLPLGSKGELVFTSLDKEAFPLLRYRTRDICILSRESQIETVLLNCGYAPNYQIIVDRVNNTDTFDVHVEMREEDFSDIPNGITQREKQLQSAMKTMLGINPRVRLVAPKSIARSEGKAVRVIDKRKLID